MTKVQKPDPDLPSRSDSFLRMLELEKRYKMQRIQGHAPPTITSPSTSSPSAQPNHPFKARRASGHPPLSHQTQIMKAMRRNSALPSLSISIPPSPTDGPTAGPGGLLGEPQPKNGANIKTVTFSGPEDEDAGASSDQSSICQSPSWEQYGRKKQKKPKKREAEQDKKSKEKSAITLKKKGNRLSKVPPPHVQGVDSLAAKNRSQSAPELEMYLKSDTGKLDTPKPTPPLTMANQKANGKPKSKGFLSSFRLQHGNVAAVQKILDGQRGSMDGNPAPGSPMFKPHPAVTGIDPNFTNPRKPPSIRSAVSNSTRSISSLDQLPASRHSSNSGHGRSQSLLTSTLNKLKGPSYLYFRPGEGTDEAHAQRPSTSQEPATTPNWSNDQAVRRPIERQPESPKEQLMPPSEPQQQLPQFIFPPKPKQVTAQPAANIAARRVQNQSHFVESNDINNGYESPEPTSFRNRHVQMPPPRAPSREPAFEREMRARSDRVPRASRQQAQQMQQVESQWSEENRPPQPRQPNRAFERQYHPVRQANMYVQPQVEAWEEAKHGPESSSSSQDDEANLDTDRFNKRQLNLEREDEEDRVSVGTHASTIRPHSRRQGQSSPETNGRKHVTFPPSPSAIGTAVTSDAVDMGAPTARIESSQPEEPVEREKVARTEKPMRIERSADYFSFISQAYAPPSLELRSPMDGKFPSPRIDEEPEEDDDLDHILRHIPIRGQANDVPSPFEIANQTAASNIHAPNRMARQKPAKDSPSMSSHYSDSDVPAFERLGLSPKAARILAGAETSSTSTSQSNTDPGRSTSERSSSSTCDDNPPTPDSSRPQSRKGLPPPQTESASNIAVIPSTHSCARSYCGVDCQDTILRVVPPAEQSSRSTNGDANIQDDSWSRTALPIDLENQPTETSSKPSDQTSSPPLVATPTSVTFAEDVKENLEVEELIARNPYQRPIPPRAQSALELHSTTFESSPKNQPLYTKKAKGGISSISLPNSPPSEPVDAAPRKSALRASRKNTANSDETPSSAAALVSPGAAYLQEARKAAQLPLPALVPPSRALRPHYAHKNSSHSVKSAGAVLEREHQGQGQGRSPAEPMAKMLVECCQCKFFHDMPSRVYQCMAKPDSVVEDKLLGVSATITTMVKCPWCAHGMSTQCCAGYAAVVYLKEKLHGK
ncbi:hypothetical protein Hte_012418 [Hypoxylon texense]